jgi:hypothetical protein
MRFKTMRLQKQTRSQVTRFGRALLLGAAAVGLSLVVLAEATAQKISPGIGGGGIRTPSPGNNFRGPSLPTNPGGRGPSYPRPDRPGGGGGGPNWGAIGTGVAIGVATGVILNNAANANQPPPDQRAPRQRNANRPQGPRPNVTIPPANERRLVPDEVVIEVVGNFAPQAMEQLAARHRLTRLESQSFALTNSTFFRWRIADGRPVRTVLRALGNEVAIRAAQPNYVYGFAQQQQRENTFKPQSATPPVTPVMATSGALPAATGGDPAQYALGKLRLGEAHSLAKGNDILVAVIDSGVDVDHAELAGVIAGSFDALESKEKAHSHGTGIAGAIAAHSRLMGVAPAARILAIRAFATSGATAEATTFAILRGIDHAVTQGARVINMSFAGPADPGLSRQLAAARARNIVLIAAAGNAGPKSPPLYPAADPNVIAVSATDAEDKLFVASNRGHHIAITAPGVDILLPAPDANYQVTSGTSFAAAHVSGIAALILERKPGLTPDAVRRILISTAKDLGPRGKDDQYGAGLADAYQAILAVEPRTAGPAPAGAGRSAPAVTAR